MFDRVYHVRVFSFLQVFTKSVADCFSPCWLYVQGLDAIYTLANCFHKFSGIFLQHTAISGPVEPFQFHQ